MRQNLPGFDASNNNSLFGLYLISVNHQWLNLQSPTPTPTPMPELCLSSSQKVKERTLDNLFLLEKGKFYFINRICFLVGRKMVACRVSSDDGDSWTHNTDAAVCIQRIRMGIRVLLLNDDGCCYLLFLLSHVESAGPLREGWTPPYQIP